MTIQPSYLKRSQRVTIITLDNNSTWTYDAPLWTLTEVSEPSPAGREDYVTVPGRAGVLDLSRALTGDPRAAGGAHIGEARPDIRDAHLAV